MTRAVEAPTSPLCYAATLLLLLSPVALMAQQTPATTTTPSADSAQQAPATKPDAPAATTAPPTAAPDTATQSDKAQGSQALPSQTQVKTTSGVPNGSVGSAIAQPTSVSTAPKQVEGSVGSAFSQPGSVSADSQKVHGGEVAPVALPGTNAKPAVKVAPTDASGVNSAISQPSTTGGVSAHSYKPGTSTSNALPGQTQSPLTNFSTTVRDAPAEAISEPTAAPDDMPVNGQPGSAVAQPELNQGKLADGDTGSAVTLPDTASADAIAGDTGKAVEEPTVLTGSTRPDGDTGTAVNQPSVAPTNGITGDTGKAVEEPNAINTAVKAEGDTGSAVSQPTAAPVNAVSGDTNKAVDEPNTINTAVKAEGDTLAAVKAPAAAEANAISGDTSKAVEEPGVVAHNWSPDTPTGSAVSENTNQPQLYVPGVAAGQTPYIHSAVDAPTTSSAQYKFKNGTAPGMEKLVLVAPTDTRNFGNATRQMTTEGHIVINVPVGWRRSVGPGLLYYVQDKTPLIKNPLRSYEAAIYVGTALIDPSHADKESMTFQSAESFIRADITGFRSRYKKSLVKELPPLRLPLTKAHHVSYVFQSHEKDNAFEEVIYIDEGDRVLALTLSAFDQKTFAGLQAVFHKFAQTYQGNIPYGTRTQPQ